MKHHSERPLIEPNRVYSREETAEVLNVSLSTIKRLIAARQLRVSQPPGMRRVLILGQHILDLIAATEVKDPTTLDDNSHSGADDEQPPKTKRRE
jgi:excisionase family DNA binding protein